MLKSVDPNEVYLTPYLFIFFQTKRQVLVMLKSVEPTEVVDAFSGLYGVCVCVCVCVCIDR
jgi:hypothetical protein